LTAVVYPNFGWLCYMPLPVPYYYLFARDWDGQYHQRTLYLSVSQVVLFPSITQVVVIANTLVYLVCSA